MIYTRHRGQGSENLLFLLFLLGLLFRLLRRVHVPTDSANYGEFRDYGKYGAIADYHGEKSIPEGYWVYVFPYWYIWAEQAK